ncbi:MAG: VCBS repeat-containing protein [Acidobacteriota bacterium]
MYIVLAFGLSILAAPVASTPVAVEISSDSLETVLLDERESAAETPPPGGTEVPYPTTPDWENDLRIQVGGLQVADMNGDGRQDVVVGCYISNSFPPYDDWRNFIYFNTGSGLEGSPSWASDDQRSTGDIQVALLNDDAFPDVFAANGGGSYDPSVIYFGGPNGPATTPGWLSTDSSWTNYALPFDFDHDGDVDVVTANQGRSQDDPFRPIYIFESNAGVLPTTPAALSPEMSIQNFLAFGHLDDDEWEDLAVSKWANFESGVYRNDQGTLESTTTWTTGDDDTDKGVAWADVDDNGDQDLALGHDPTLVYFNTDGTLGSPQTATGTFFGHAELRFEDIDLDGDPDLAEVHFANGKAQIYLNRGGVLDTAPTWTFDSSAVGTALAFGDIDGDGAPDLVVGNSGDPSVMVFMNRQKWLLVDGFESGNTDAWTTTVP